MVVGAAIINDMSHVLPASGLQRRPSLRARLLGQPTVVDVICERESRLGGSLICPFDLDAVGSAITLKVPESTSPGADMFAFGSGIHEPLTSRLTRSVALVAHETGAYDDEAASRGRETLGDALHRAMDAVVKTCGGTGTVHLWSMLGDHADALPVILRGVDPAAWPRDRMFHLPWAD